MTWRSLATTGPCVIKYHISSSSSLVIHCTEIRIFRLELLGKCLEDKSSEQAYKHVGVDIMAYKSTLLGFF